MNKFIGKLYKFMYGRYGVDELYKLGLIICVILLFINIFLNSRTINILQSLLIILLVYRALSKDINERRKENNKYLSIKKNIINRFKLIKRKIIDRNTNMYKKCPNCKTILRLPLKKGKHTCKCPNCYNKFEVKCRKNEKIKVEVIKKKKKEKR